MTDKETKVCFTTFIFGDKYQGYIPFLIYSIKKSYPDYYIVIYVHGTLRNEIKEMVQSFMVLGGISIIENYFNEFKRIKPFVGKSLRWLIRDEMLLNFDYVYIGDIDIIIIRENPILHVQHVEHMKKINLPFSNVTRTATINNRNFSTLYYRIRVYSFWNAVISFLKGIITENRLSGLHFVKSKDYFPVVLKHQIEQENIFLKNKYLKYYQGFSCEPVLYNICKEADFNLENIGKYSDVGSLDYKNISNPSFRPHHGIHLGIFRNLSDISRVNKEVANSDTYRFYIKAFKNYLNDPIFQKMIQTSDLFIKNQFINLLAYYKIDFSIISSAN